MKKRIVLIGLCLLMTAPVSFADNEVSVETEIVSTAIAKDDFSLQLLEKIKMQRSTMYNALNLTPCQIKSIEEIDQKRYKELEPELRKMSITKCKIKKIADCMEKGQGDYTIKDVKSAKKDFDAAKNNIKVISGKYDKDMMKVLTSEQKSKYTMIRKLKRTDLKKLQKSQQNGSKPSELRPFGKPVSQAQYSEDMKKQRSLWNKIRNCRKSK